MATPNPRTPLSNTPSRRAPNESSPNRPAVASSVPASTGTGLVRAPSFRQSRPIRKTPNRASVSFNNSDLELEDEEAKSKNAELLRRLEERAEKAERAEQQYKLELQAILEELDKARQDQTAAEEQDFQRQTELNRLQGEISDLRTHTRELERQHSEDEQLLQQEQDRHLQQQTQQQATIGRLNEQLRLNGIERYNASRGASMSEPHAFLEERGSDDSGQREGSTPQIQASNLAYALQQKEDTINSLQIDLTEIQLKLAQQEHVQDRRRHGLEQQMSEYQVLNARLKEENESYELLLREKTLKGEFMHHNHSPEESHGMSSLAEELESTDDAGEESTEGQTEAYRKLESDNKSSKAEVEALRLYIDKIIGRLLSHPGFEQIILQDKDDPPQPPERTSAEKALPAIPDQQAPAAATTLAGAATGFLQRARSVVQRPGGRGRPTSVIQPAAAAPSANENPITAPSIPLNRGHRRARSDQAQADMAAAAVVHQMNRGPPMRTVSPLSPGIRPLSPPLSQISQGQGSYFGASASSTTGNRGSSSANSISDSHSDEQKSNTDGSSIAPPLGAERQSQASIPGAVMKQNQLRPLRLVQQTASEEDVNKRANRNSIFGWFRGSTIESQDE